MRTFLRRSENSLPTLHSITGIPTRSMHCWWHLPVSILPGFIATTERDNAFTADWVQKLDQTNPQVAATLAGSLASWRDILPELGAQMKSALERISESGPLSTDVAELVSLSLKSG